jgi:hypothetical protein
MFRTVPLSIIRSYSLYTQQWYMSYIQVCRQLSSSSSILILLDGTSSILILLLIESCLQTCMTYTIAMCTVNNSWWWTEELLKCVEFHFQNKYEKLVHLVGFIIRKIWTKLDVHIYKASVCTSQRTLCASLKDPWFLRCVAVYCENYAQYIVIPLRLNAESLVLSMAVRILTSKL